MSDNPQLFAAINSVANSVNQLIADNLKGNPDGLYRSASYLPNLGGKRLRPFVTVMSGKMFGAPEEPLYLSALGVELLHNFTLVHDDIIDHDEYRRGHPTVHKIFGEPIAILAGDLLFAKAFEAADMAEKIIKNHGIVNQLVRAAIKLDEGQYLDVSFENKKEISLEQYLEMITLKTGVLYEVAAIIGGLVGNKLPDSSEIALLADYGRNLGLCFQIRDDYLGVFGDPRITGKPVGSDIRRGKRTAVTILASKYCDDKTLSLINGVAESNQIDDNVLSKIVEGLRRQQVDTKCMDLAGSFGKKAIKALDSLPECREKTLLRQLVEYACNRDH
jgi:geranylgeranyl diphosphate synthase type I